MATIYFVRHAQPDHNWKDDRTRPLTEEGIKDSEKVYEALKNIKLTYAISSPYRRSIDTIRHCAKSHNLKIDTDERFRERKKGLNGNNFGMFQKRWSDFDYCEDDGESLRSVQDRNISALFEILDTHSNDTIILGTHGTALSTILNYFDKSYNCDSFLRMIDYMPYIIRLDFIGRECVDKKEILIVEKEFKGNNRADKK